MNSEFVAAINAAIAAAPNSKIAHQLETLLNRLEATGGELPNLPGVSTNPSDNAE